jgi:hypothetical protein
MVVREHHVGDLLGCELDLGERSQDRVAPGTRPGSITTSAPPSRANPTVEPTRSSPSLR